MTDTVPGKSGEPAGVVLVTFNGEKWAVSRGQALTLGRSRAYDVRLPDDEHLSRRAGSLPVLNDCVLISNDSRRTTSITISSTWRALSTPCREGADSRLPPARGRRATSGTAGHHRSP
ncbi:MULTISPECIES: hypothetical protein [unclassified Nonomuraea]|uniref:hypothetical protein n=1 Tax=unclassified Nonomuraea TaxID=2593643 RepID=UPI0033FC2322